MTLGEYVAGGGNDAAWLRDNQLSTGTTMSKLQRCKTPKYPWRKSPSQMATCWSIRYFILSGTL